MNRVMRAICFMFIRLKSSHRDNGQVVVASSLTIRATKRLLAWLENSLSGTINQKQFHPTLSSVNERDTFFSWFLTLHRSGGCLADNEKFSFATEYILIFGESRFRCKWAHKFENKGLMMLYYMIFIIFILYKYIVLRMKHRKHMCFKIQQLHI